MHRNVYASGMLEPSDEKTIAELRALYPDLTDKELGEADFVLTQYFELAWEIYEESVLSKRPGQEKTGNDFQADQ